MYLDVKNTPGNVKNRGEMAEQCIRTTTHSPNRVSDTLGKSATHTTEERHIRVFSPYGVSTIAKRDTSKWGSFSTPQQLCLR